MTIWDILSDNQRVILWSDAEAGLIYTWNYSQTLQCWRVMGADYEPDGSSPGWEEVDARNLSEHPKNARQAIQRWHKQRQESGYHGNCPSCGESIEHRYHEPGRGC